MPIIRAQGAASGRRGVYSIKPSISNECPEEERCADVCEMALGTNLIKSRFGRGVRACIQPYTTQLPKQPTPLGPRRQGSRAQQLGTMYKRNLALLFLFLKKAEDALSAMHVPVAFE